MTEAEITTNVEEANHSAERAYWWMKNIDADAAHRLGVADMVNNVLSLLQKVDNITIDIAITIKNKIQQ